MADVMAERESILAAIEGQTLCDLFQTTVAEHADAKALAWREGSTWHHATWRDYGEQVRKVAMGLMALGVGKGDFVAIMATNRPEHVIADTGAFHAAATPVSLYNTLADDQIAYVAGNCDAKVAILDGPGYHERWSRVRDQLPNLQHVIVIDDAEQCEGDVLSWDDLLARGEQHLAEAGEAAFEERWRSVEPDDPCTLIYTSGTTGPPKGVIETHKGVLFLMESASRHLDFPMTTRGLSYLPLAHVAERMFSHWQGIKYAVHVHFCPDYTQIAEYIPVARPYAFLAVPRVWEKMRSALLSRVDQATGVKGALGRRAFAILPQIGAMRVGGRSPSVLLGLQERLFEKLVYAKVRHALGLDECRVAITGAAPFPDDLLLFFAGLGIEVLNVYGMTETTAVLTGVQPGHLRPGSVGTPLPGIEVRIAEDGEILGRGPNSTPGYWKREEATRELIDEDGWLHTGDLGRIDEDGHLRIIGRKKELIVTASGKNISPANIEALIKQHPLIGQVCVVGDDRQFVSALIVLDPEAAEEWARKHGLPFESLAQFSQRDDVVAEVQKAVDAANAKLARVEQVKKFELLPNDWTVESGELTPSLKLKRHVVTEKYSDVIDALYPGG